MLALWWTWAASAATPVLVDGLSVEEALDRLVAIKPGVYETYFVDEVAGSAAPVTLGGAYAEICRGKPAKRAALESLKEKADRAAAVDYDLDAAGRTLDQAIDLVACLNEPVPAELVAGIFFVRGFVYQEKGLADRARDTWEIAASIDPQYDDPNYANEGFRRVAAEVSRRPTGTIDVIPDPVSFTVDGEPAAEAVSRVAGRHFVQVEGESWTSFMVGIEAGTRGSVVVPALLGPQHLVDLHRPEAGRQLALVLNNTRFRNEPVIVVTADGIWERQGDLFARLAGADVDTLGVVGLFSYGEVGAMVGSLPAQTAAGSLGVIGGVYAGGGVWFRDVVGGFLRVETPHSYKDSVILDGGDVTVTARFATVRAGLQIDATDPASQVKMHVFAAPSVALGMASIRQDGEAVERAPIVSVGGQVGLGAQLYGTSTAGVVMRVGWSIQPAKVDTPTWEPQRVNLGTIEAQLGVLGKPREKK